MANQRMHNSLGNRQSCLTSAKDMTINVESAGPPLEGMIHKYTATVYLTDLY